MKENEKITIIENSKYYFIFIPAQFSWEQILTKEMQQLFILPGVKMFYSPGKETTRNNFLKTYPPFSIAIDGYVPGKTVFQKQIESGPRLIIDHHPPPAERDNKELGEENDRLIYRSTCEQTYIYLRQRFFSNHFQNKNKQTNINIFFNDIDEDVALTLWLLLNRERVKKYGRDLKTLLLVTETGVKDTLGGSFSLTDEGIKHPDSSEEDERLKWTFFRCEQMKHDPYFRNLSPKGICRFILEATWYRIKAYKKGESGRLKLDGRYEVLWEDKLHNWLLVTEPGHESRVQMINDGVQAIVSVIRERKWTENYPHYDYTLLRLDEGSSFPLDIIFSKLNQIEHSLSQSTVLEICKQLLNDKSCKDWRQATVDEMIPIAKKLIESANDYVCKKEQNEKFGWGGTKKIGGSPRKKGSFLWPNLLAAFIHLYCDEFYKNFDLCT